MRYVVAAPPTPVPTAPPTLPPTPPPPTPSPTPTPKPKPPEEHFLVFDYIFAPKVYNEFSPGNAHLGASATTRVGLEFNAGGIPFMLEADGRQY